MPVRTNSSSNLALAADPRRVHKSVGPAAPLEHGVDGVAGGPRYVANDRPRLSEKPVEEAGPV